MHRNITLGIVLTAFVMFAGGCLIMSGKSIDETGTRISDATLSHIQIGETTEGWLLATLGKPTMRTEVEDDPEVVILRYDYCRTKSEGGAVFLIFAGGSETTTRTITYFELVHGVVSRIWTESP